MSGGYEIAVWALLVIASITDVMWGKIFNAVTFAFIATGLACRLYLGGTNELGEAVTGIVTAFALFFPLWRLGVMAAGDVKLLMAVGAWSSPFFVLQLAMLSVVVGAVVGASVLLRKAGLKGGLTSLKHHLRVSSSANGLRIPFAPAFLCALFVVKVAEMKGWSIL